MLHHVEVDDGVGRDVAPFDLPSGVDRLSQQADALDDEHTLLVTSTAAPQEAPQSLNPLVRERESSRVWGTQRAALAASVSAVKATGSEMARSAITLRSTSMPAALRPAMNRL